MIGFFATYHLYYLDFVGTPAGRSRFAIYQSIIKPSPVHHKIRVVVKHGPMDALYNRKRKVINAPGREPISRLRLLFLVSTNPQCW